MKTTSLKLFQPATLAALAIVTLWGVSMCPAQAGYTVTLQQVGPDVVGTGSGAIDLTGLTFLMQGTAEPIIKAANPAYILTGAVVGVDIYAGITGPTSFGSGDLFFADSGSGDPVGMRISDMTLGVPHGYVSGVALSSSATWNNATFASLGVTPGTYVWTWGTGANQNFTLQILPGSHPSFFNGQIALGNGVYYLQFPNGTPFGYYVYLSDPHFIYHFDMGYEYWFDANDGHSGIFFYDFASNHFFYTSPSFPFPYLYDFTLNTVLYYYPDTNNPGHYTTNPRYFYNFATGQIITM